MLGARSQTEELAVRLMGNPRQGMPVADIRIQASQGPKSVLQRDSARHMRILIHVFRIIEIDKVVAGDAAKTAPVISSNTANCAAESFQK